MWRMEGVSKRMTQGRPRRERERKMRSGEARQPARRADTIWEDLTRR